jgi:SAM-dependent methyltransferase
MKMNRQTTGKLKFLLDAVFLRLSQNIDFFKRIEYTYYCGTKAFKGSVEVKNEKFANLFNTQQVLADKSEIADEILKYAPGYDRLLLRYFERGSCFEIEATDKKVSQKTIKDESGRNDNKKENNIRGIDFGKRDYIIKVGEADALLKEIGILSAEGKIKNDMIRKYNQIDHFIELAKSVTDSFSKDKKVCVLDCACGKSYLSFVLNYYMRDILKLNCHFTGVDYKQNVIDESRKMAKNLGYNNMEFVCADMNSYCPNEKIDLLVSLHACDTATDMSLGLGIRNKVKAIICVPCCHKEMLASYSYEPFEALLGFPVFKKRIADDLTDAMRCLYLKANGYEVSATEYISPLETPKNLMIKAVKKSDGDKKAALEYNKLEELLNVNLSVKTYSNIPQNGISAEFDEKN